MNTDTVLIPIDVLLDATVIAYSRARPGRRVIVSAANEKGTALLQIRGLGTRRNPPLTYFATAFEGYMEAVGPGMVGANSGDRSEQTTAYTLRDFCEMHGYEAPKVTS